MEQKEEETKRGDKKDKKIKHLLLPYYDPSTEILEIGVDEVGRGPLFGRVYTAAVILPKEHDAKFDHSKMKDSKKFHSVTKIVEASDYIKANAIAWAVSYEDEKVIDDINILQATQQSMHKCITQLVREVQQQPPPRPNIKLLVDGNYFKPLVLYNPTKKMIEPIDFVCVEGGDNKYSAIAAASILAKVARDTYIEELCEQNPTLSEHYNIDSNKGYGAKKHIAGIKEHGITPWHRKSFGICKTFV
jgi:ribonuclease HII